MNVNAEISGYFFLGAGRGGKGLVLEEGAEAVTSSSVL